jgi:hypothetical protein
VIRKPSAETPPELAHVCAIPRERLRLDDLARQVNTDGFAVPRCRLGADAWSMESPKVAALTEKIRKAGIPLKEFAGSGPYRGILTGFNDAFLIDTPTKERLVAADRKSAKLFRPYLRGQDIDRWSAEWSGLWMLALKSSGNHPWPWANERRKAESVFASTYPAIHAHLNQYRDALKKRQDQGEYWWELRACAYWDRFDQPKVMYQDITWEPCFCLDTKGTLSNNTVYFITTADRWVLSVLNSPVAWWFAWRGAQHCKDEGLRFFTVFMESFPIPNPGETHSESAAQMIGRLGVISSETQQRRRDLLKLLEASFGIEKPSQRLARAVNVDAATFVEEVRKSRGKKKPLSQGELQALGQEHIRSVKPLHALVKEGRELEVRLSELVHSAYGLTPDEVTLMWQTAPPRMPGMPSSLRAC